MNHEPDQALRTDTAQSLRSLIARRWWLFPQLIAFGVAAYCSVHAARILNATSHAVYDNFDDAIGWLGAALLATFVVAWTPSLPKTAPREWPARLTGWLRSHWMELVLVAGLFAAGFFMRFFRFQDTLSPIDGLCCEEHINGGVAYRALQGERPLLFPTERWASAVGFLAFGENTLGLRFFYTALGGAELVVIYLILRQLVSVPPALFGLGLYAAAWWPSLANRHAFETGLFVALLFALLLVRGTRARSAVMFAGMGVLAGLLSYEYEAFKMVPMVGVGFMAALAAAAVLFPLTPRLLLYGERLVGLAKAWWRPVLVFVMACAIVLTPMIIGTRNGFDLYLTSVHRNENDRGGSRLAENWEDQVKWVAQLFLPFREKEYRFDPPLDVPGEPLLDPLTATLAVVGLAAGIVFFYRGYRLFFVTWAIAVLAGGSLILQNWFAWKFISALPLLIVLTALFIDDVKNVIARFFGRPGTVALSALLAVGVAFSFWWNADKLFNDAPPKLVASGIYDGEQDQFYAYCDYLGSRGEDNRSLSFNQAILALGFHNEIGALDDQARMWGDFIWICHDLEGESLPAAEEAWPVRDVGSGRTTLVLSYREPFEKAIAELNRAIPGLGNPDFVTRGPNGGYTIVAWEFEDGTELMRTGLWGQYTPAGGASPAIGRSDPVEDLLWDAAGLPVQPPFDVRWRGVVHVDEQRNLSLEAETDDPVSVRINGEIVYSTLDGAVERNTRELQPGWHAVEIFLQKESPGGGVQLAWVDSAGSREALDPSDLSPVAEWGGWLHERTLQAVDGGERWTTHRLDFTPHRASTGVLRAGVPGRVQSVVVNETWTSVWTPPAPGTYVFGIQPVSGPVTLLVDGEPVALSLNPSGSGVEGVVTVDDGPHRLQILQDIPPDPNLDTGWSGFEVSLTRVIPRPGGAEPLRVPSRLDVLPY